MTADPTNVSTPTAGLVDRVKNILLTPKVVTDAWDYFKNEQTKTTKYQSFLSDTDQPPTFLNAEIMAKFRPLMQPFYYDATKYKSYLDQLGITYPTTRASRLPTKPVP